MNRLLMVPFKQGDDSYIVGLQNDITELKGFKSPDKFERNKSNLVKHHVNNILAKIFLSYAVKLKKGEMTDETKREIYIQFRDEYLKIKEFLLNVDMIDSTINHEN